MAVTVKHGHALILERKTRVRKAGRLGRHKEFDKRSAKFKAEKVIPIRLKEVTGQAPVLYKRPTGPFDQGQYGSCTGNGVEGQAATVPHRIAHHRYAEPEAMHVYADATAIDPFPGTFLYPPARGDDTGSSVLSAVKAAITRGLFGPNPQYNWVFKGAQELAAGILTIGPATVGVNWYESFDRPDSSGLVTISAGAQIRGGHAFEVLGYDPARDEFLVINSWGLYWGIKGRFIIPGPAMDRLLHEDGEAVLVTTKAA